MRQHLPAKETGAQTMFPYYSTQQLKVCIFPKLIGTGKACFIP